VLNAVIIVSIVAPVVEELVFRGLILRSVRNFVLRRGERRGAVTSATRRSAVFWAVLVSSVTFAALHLAQADSLVMLIVLGGSTLAVGVINALVAIRTGRLGAPILTHVLYNGSSVAIALAIASGSN
jgi:membrane protease YdiL (CAAX protease family)